MTKHNIHSWFLVVLIISMGLASLLFENPLFAGVVVDMPKKDGIVALDNPNFDFLYDEEKKDELVLIVSLNNVKKAYPIHILEKHQIVNDILEEVPIVVTYFPLTGSAHAFLRGEHIFSDSGQVYNSNLVMYDRKTETYWSQIEGKAILGELSGQELVSIPVDVIPWNNLKNSQVPILSEDTGFDYGYGTEEYKDYSKSTKLLFPVEHRNNLFHSKKVVIGIVVNGVAKAYPEEMIRNFFIDNNNFIDEVGGKELIISRDNEGMINFVADGEQIANGRDYWFAWYAFHPDTLIYNFD